MTQKQVLKIIKIELNNILTQFEVKNDNFLFFQTDDYMIQFNYYTQKIGGEIYLDVHFSFKLNFIENKWTKYQPELGLQTGLFDLSFWGTYNNIIDKNQFPTLSNLGIKVSYEASEEWVRDTSRRVVQDYYLPYLEKLKDIKYCDLIINKEIEITDETCKLSPVDGLPFRKIFIAEEAHNPRIDEIKIAMRKYCDEQYELGLKHNFQRLCFIKPVFEKLFGKE